MASKKEIMKRRVEVNTLRIFGMKNWEIAERLKVNIKTVEKDLHDTKEERERLQNNDTALKVLAEKRLKYKIINDELYKRLALAPEEKKAAILNMISQNEDRETNACARLVYGKPTLEIGGAGLVKVEFTNPFRKPPEKPAEKPKEDEKDDGNGNVVPAAPEAAAVSPV